jgi:hypothetical protein
VIGALAYQLIAGDSPSIEGQEPEAFEFSDGT